MKRSIVPQEHQKSTGQKVLSTAYKVGGWTLRIKAIVAIIFGIGLILFGIYFAITTSIVGLFFSVIGLIILLSAWLYWKRAKSLVKGRFY